MLSSYKSSSDTTKAYVQMHLSVLLWGATGVLGRGIELNEALLVWYRLIIVSVSLFIYIKYTNGNLLITRKQFIRLTIVGILLMMHWVCFYGGIKYSNVSVTLSLLSATSLFTALLEPLIERKKVNKSELLFSVIAMVGIGIIFYSDENTYGIGMALALMAAFLGAFFNILNKDVVKEMESSVVSFYEIFIGMLLLTLFLPLYNSYFEVEKLLPSATDWVLLAVLAILCTHITMILSLNALKHLSAFTVTLSINLEPVYGILLAFLIFGENNNLNAGFFIGTLVIMLSVLLHTYFTRINMKKKHVSVEK
jgi:drug/metabolite transporter (DMT)-like permease